MNGGRKMLVAIAAGAAAILLLAYFVRYEVRPIRSCPGSSDVICESSDTIFVFNGEAYIDPAPGTELARFHGRTIAERVLVARHGNLSFAILGGIVLPLLLISGSLVLLLSARNSN